MRDMLKILQDTFASIDTQPSGRGLLIEVLVKRLKTMKLKMYQETHSIPHIHIDYGGNNNHVASYNISDGERIEGDLDKKYDQAVKDWIAENGDILLEIWNALQDGAEYEEIVDTL